MRILKILLMFVFITWFSGALMAADQEKSKQEQEMMEKWMKYATPGEAHKFLQKMAGEWEATSKMWMQPGAEPTITKGPGIGKMIYGGRYLKLSYKGHMMGMPFEGMGIHAYDNHLKKFISAWIDNMGTGIMINYGTVDKSGNVLTEIAEMDDFLTGKKVKYKSVTTIISPDKFLMEMYSPGPEGEFRSLEVTHIRKK